MDIEVIREDLTQFPLKGVTDEDDTHLDEKDNEKLNQKPGFDEPIKGEMDSIIDTNIFHTDAIDECSASKQIPYFYFIKFRSYEDPNLKAKIDQADKEVHKRNQAQFQIREVIKLNKVERAELMSQLKSLTCKDKRYREILDENKKSIEPLKHASGKLRRVSNSIRKRRDGLCSSEEELNDVIYGLHYRMRHESKTLVEEKQFLREIKQLEETREKVVADVAMKTMIRDSFYYREVIQNIGVDLDGIRKQKQVVTTKITFWEEELKALNKEINSLQQELAAINNSRGEAYEAVFELRKYRDQEVEKFMSQWSNSKAFRDDYEKRSQKEREEKGNDIST